MKIFILILTLSLFVLGSELKFSPSGEILSFNSCAVSLSGALLSDEIIKLFFTYFAFGISSGIIFLAAAYNTVLYFYNRKIMFFYYSLTQIGVMLILFASTGLWLYFPINHKMFLYYHAFVPVLSTLLSALFTRSFFETSRYTPKMDIIMQGIIWIMILNTFLLFIQIQSITYYVPFSTFMLFFLLIATIRLRQGFKPAFYYLLGWGTMIISVAISEIYRTTFTINPMMLGAPIEAVLLAFALFYTLKESQKEHEKYKTILIQQSKLASMGELLGNIAHQWRQPITNLSYIFMNIKSSADNFAYIKQKSDEGMQQIGFMSETIENFRNFYQPDTQKEHFSLYEQTLYAFNIIREELDSHLIEVEVILFQDTLLFNYKNQYSQVILNLLSNSKDALIASQITSPLITIQIDTNNILISDNAGGIPQENLEKIFEPYFTTKPKNNGIGLYMSKMIIEKNMNGILTVRNTHNGALFEIYF